MLSHLRARSRPGLGVSVDLGGKVAVVTGGGGGIGASVSEVLAGAGAHVVVAEADEARAGKTVVDITASGRAASGRVCDVRDREQVEELARWVFDGLGRVDVLVNNVGHYLRTVPFAESGEDHWRELYEVNFLHVLRCTRAFLPSMAERGCGSIVNVSSVEGLRGYPPDPVYAALKAAVAHFTRSLAVDAGASGVRVNAIAPDLTQSLQVRYDEVAGEEDTGRWRIWAPVGRFGEPRDQADVVLFLASDLSRFVTGHVIPTDGGTLAAGGWFRTLRSGRWTNRPRDP
jgi:NAD(P)-dependent dehydrogenase (short-subunit alcohol dehydrogenase family)